MEAWWRRCSNINKLAEKARVKALKKQQAGRKRKDEGAGAAVGGEGMYHENCGEKVDRCWFRRA